MEQTNGAIMVEHTTDAYNRLVLSSALSWGMDELKCDACRKWEVENWNNPKGAVRKCNCTMRTEIDPFGIPYEIGVNKLVILPTCKKCGNAPCGCASEERYGYPVSQEDDLQIQTVGGVDENGNQILPKWAIEAQKDLAKPEVNKIQKFLNKLFRKNKMYG